MKNYESPVIFDNEELAEGVYATGSGGSGIDCWETIRVVEDQKWDTKLYSNWSLYVKHSAGHISRVGEFTGTILGMDTGVYIEPGDPAVCKVVVSGNTYVVRRKNYADAEFSTDTVQIQLQLHSDHGNVQLGLPWPTDCSKELSPNNNW
jgi:hypothetical protein